MNSSLQFMAGAAGVKAGNARKTAKTSAARRAGRSAERPLRLMSGALALAALAACGGGSDDDTVNTPTVLTLTGTAATGAALANAVIQAKCVGGERTDNAAANGSYTLVLPEGAALPCVLKATGPSASLYSVATGSGRSARANITSVTTLAVAHMAGGTADSYFAAFDTGAAPNNLVAAKDAATSAVLAALSTAGVDLSAAGDVFTAPLVAGSASDLYDHALDALQAKLDQADVSLADLAASIVSNVNPLVSTLSAAVSLPAELLLQAKAESCSSLRSGTYRSLDSEAWSGQDGFPVSDVVLDAASLTFNDGEETIALLPNSSARCRFTVSDGQGVDPDTEVTVSGAGVVLARYLTENVNGTWYGSVLIPKQSHTLAELAGDWNMLGRDRPDDASPYVLEAETFTLDAAGMQSHLTTCKVSSGVCETEASTGTRMVADASGGFYVQDASGSRLRAFAYRAGGGELMLAIVGTNGSFRFATRKVARELPELNSVTAGWQISIERNLTAPFFTAASPMSAYRSTVTAVDPALQRYARANVINATTGVTQPETIEINVPRAGFQHRLAAAGVLRSDGTTGNVNEWVGLPMRGMGFSPVGLTSTHALVVSVGQAQ